MQTSTDPSIASNQQTRGDTVILNQSQTILDFDKIKEFNSKSVDLIFDDKIESALDILKKIEVFLETNAIEAKTNLDKKILIIILHNLACCYQKTKDFENCISYLEAVIYHFDTSLEPKHKIKINEEYFIKKINQDQSTYSLLGDFILELRFSAKFHLQMCAVLSQAGRHIEALSHAKLAALMCEDNLLKTYYLYFQMKDQGLGIMNNSNKNVDEDYPMFAEKIKKSYKIIKDLFDRVIVIRGTNSALYCNNGNNGVATNANISSNQNSNSVLTTNGNNTLSNNINTTSTNRRTGKNSNSFIDSHNQNCNSVNNQINNNNQHSLNYYDSYLKYRSSEISTYNSNTFLTNNIRNVFGASIKKEDWIQLLNIGNIMYLSALNYEDLDLDSDPKYELLRDAILEKVVMLTVAYFCIATELRFLSPDKNNSKTNGEFYHYKAVEFASLFLPVSCPIVKHYIYSYYKHYGNDLTIVPEGNTFNMKIELLRSEIEQDKDTLTFITTKKIKYTPNLNASIISAQSDSTGNNNNKKEFNLLRGSGITKGKIEGNKAPKFRLDFACLNKITNNNPNINNNTNNCIVNNVNKKKDESSSLSGPSNNKDNIRENKDIKESNNLLMGLKPKHKEDNLINNKAANFKLNFMNIGKTSSYGINSHGSVNVPININKEVYDNFLYASSNKEYDLFQNNNILAKKSRISEEKAPKFQLNFANINKNANSEKDNAKSKSKKISNSSNKINKKAETARVKTGKIQISKNSPFYCGNNSSSNNQNMNRTSTSKQRAETDRIKISKIQLSKGAPFYCNTNRSNYNNKQRGVSASKKKGNITDRGVKNNIMNKKV